MQRLFQAASRFVSFYPACNHLAGHPGISGAVDNHISHPLGRLHILIMPEAHHIQINIRNFVKTQAASCSQKAVFPLVEPPAMPITFVISSASFRFCL